MSIRIYILYILYTISMLASSMKVGIYTADISFSSPYYSQQCTIYHIIKFVIY